MDQIDEIKNASSLELFLEDCRDFNEDINNLSTSLNEENINNLNINSDINELIRQIRGLKEYRDNLEVSVEDRRKINEAFDELKLNFVDLKNKHIHIYNAKVNYVNDKIKLLNSKFNREELVSDVLEILDKLSVMEECNTFVDGNWDQNQYLNALEYDKLNENYRYLNEIESKLGIVSNEPIKLFAGVNYISDTIKKMKINVNGELSLTSINTNLSKCISLSERITGLDISYHLMKEQLSEQMNLKYGIKIEDLRDELEKIEKDLLEKKSSLIKKANYYAMICNELDQISDKYDMLAKKILEYEGKCTEDVIYVFNNYLDVLSDSMLEIRDRLKEYHTKGLFNKEQLDNIFKKVNIITDKHKNINLKANYNPILLTEEERDKGIDSRFSRCENMLRELDDKVSGIEGTIKGNERREMDTFIKNKKELLDGLYHTLEDCRIFEPDKYDELKIKVDKYQEEFDRIYDIYNGKCAFVVKTTRSVKKLYKKHKKLGLVSAGLSSLALLSSSFSIIPAIMHGNSVIAKAVPSLKSMFNFFNNILGDVVGATLTKEGLWKMASGVMLSSQVATTALLKSLAMLSGGVVSLLTPVFLPQLISQIKKLIEKIKQSELKQKLSDAYQEGKDKVNDAKLQVKTWFDEKKVTKDFDILFDEYCESGMNLEDFCKKENLSQNEMEILELKIKKKLLEQEEKEKINQVLKASTSRRKSLW